MKPTTKLATAAAAGTLAQVAGAAISSVDFSETPFTANLSTNVYIDFENLTASTSFFAGADISLQLYSYYFESAYTRRANLSDPWLTSGSGTTAFKLSIDDAIVSTGNATIYPAYLDVGDTGDWQTPTSVQGYLGFFHTNGNQAWAYVNYNDADNTIQLLGLGYNSDGTILAGQTAVPEPSSAAALAALVAGSAAVYQRRRRAA